MKKRNLNKLTSLSIAVLVFTALCLTFTCLPTQAAPADRVALYGHRTSTAASARVVGEVTSAQTIPLTLALASRDPQGLQEFLQRVYDPTDPLYRHFLTPEQFAARFSPSRAEYAAVAAFARSQGLTITGTTPNRLLLHVAAPSATVEAAFGVRLQEMVDAQGRMFHAPSGEPTVPAAVAPLLVGVVGLDNSAVWQPQSMDGPILPNVASLADPLEVGTGPNDGLSPADIRSIYNLNTLPTGINGSGQTLALMELDSYLPSDITNYESYFHAQFGTPTLPTVTPVPVDGGSGTMGSGQAEVTLDIELQMAVAPGASRILVYEGPNTFDGVLDTYNQIAVDDQAAQVSTSWGLAEDEIGTSIIESESPIFAEMAAQGQTIYAASGDSGAKDDGSTLSVDDPASQPFVTGTGGTSLSPASGELYGSESVWGDGGGGISAVWPMPSWQLAVITNSAANASTAMRNVPDVAFDADPNTGYAIALNGGWALYGGTSCAAPIWAGFTALVNQQRAANSLGSLGFANPRLYAIGSGVYGSYANDFHDIVSGSNGSGGYYNAVTGYDDATGLGTFNGANLWADLSQEPTNAPVLTDSVTSNSVTLNWTQVPGATGYKVYRTLGSGSEGATPYATTANTTLTDTAVTTGTTYEYYVTATVPGSISVPSNPVSVTPGAAPTIRTAAAASPSTVTGTTTALSVLGHDPQRETLTYTWKATGPAPVTFSVNNSSTANDTTSTFTQAGSYNFTVTVKNSSGLSVTSSVPVTVQQTPTQATVTPATATVIIGATQQFTAADTDQFGNADSAPPTWTVTGGGTISSSGLFTATTAGGPFTVTATLGSVSGTASVTVAEPAPAYTQGNAATFISQSVPSTMVAGQTYSVSVTYENTGTTTWTSADNYHLGSQNPQDNSTWGFGRVLLPAGTTSVASGQSVTFTFTITAPTSTGTDNWQWRMVQDGVEWFGDYTPNVPVSVTGGTPTYTQGNAATFISQSVPSTMVAGQTYSVSVTYENTGTTTWTSADNYHLGSQNPQDNSTWGFGRVLLPAGTTSVASGQSVTFTFTITAPTSTGTDNWQWRMVQDGVEWFGDYTPNVPVSVTGGTPTYTQGNAATFISQSVPSTMVAGQTYSVSVTYENTGTTTWTSADNYHLGSQNPQDNSTWGFGRVLLPAGTTSVVSGQSVTFTFTITAPTSTGTANWQWRMVQDGVQWFGDYTPNVPVSVTEGS